MIMMRELTCHPAVLSACMSGLTLVAFFVVVVVVGGIGKYVMAVGEFYDLYDVWWGWCWRGGRGINGST